MIEEAVLLILRIAGGLSNIVHDCDEVYNYWEPLHYLVHGSGMQTWEYSSEFALRPYLYLLVHWPVVKLASLLPFEPARKYMEFTILRLCLSLIAAGLDIRLIRAARAHLGSHSHFALLLAVSTGCFLAPATLLPSTFAMYCMTAAVTGVLQGRQMEVIVASVLGVLLGWPVAGIAFSPYALYILLAPRLGRSVMILLATALPLLAALAVTDAHFYGKPTASLWNFIRYNVFGGGSSALYGVEPWHYYLQNGALNFNFALALALAYPLVAVLQALRVTSLSVDGGLTLAIAPLFVWLMAISALPHKEERFLYVTYPQIALAAAATLGAMPRLASDLTALYVRLNASSRDRLRSFGRGAALLLLVASLVTSVSRTAAVLTYYRAPMLAWRHVAEQASSARVDNSTERLPEATVCVGQEWFRYPSSFFLPESARLAFVDDGLEGLLPKAFDRQAGGTRAAPLELNDRNERDARLLLPDRSTCDYFVSIGALSDPDFDVTSRHPFLENSRGRFPFRTFWLPWPGWTNNNQMSSYTFSVRTRRAARVVDAKDDE